MAKRYGFGESKYEHFPEGWPNPLKDLGGKLPAGKLLQGVKEQEAKEKDEQSEPTPTETAELIRLAKLLVTGKLPPQIAKDSEFYALLQDIAKQKLGLVPISELFGKKE